MSELINDEQCLEWLLNGLREKQYTSDEEACAAFFWVVQDMKLRLLARGYDPEFVKSLIDYWWDMFPRVLDIYAQVVPGTP